MLSNKNFIINVKNYSISTMNIRLPLGSCLEIKVKRTGVPEDSKKDCKKIFEDKLLMNNQLIPKTSLYSIFFQKNMIENLRGITKCYTFASL